MSYKNTQDKPGTQRLSAVPDQSIKRGRSDGTNALPQSKSPTNRTTTNYPRTTDSPAARSQGSGELGERIRRGYVRNDGAGKGRGKVSDVTVAADGTERVRMIKGSKGGASKGR